MDEVRLKTDIERKDKMFGFGFNEKSTPKPISTALQQIN